MHSSEVQRRFNKFTSKPGVLHDEIGSALADKFIDAKRGGTRRLSELKVQLVFVFLADCRGG